MAEYKRPKTRIKIVEDGWGVRYYPQYSIVVVPFILREWQPIYEEMGNLEYLTTLDEAKWRVDRFLARHKHYWLKDKKKVSVIDYP